MSQFNLFELADALTKTHIKQESGQDSSLQVALVASKKTALQASVDVLLVI